jgi:ACS family hexuronate transporter-like MFS transporter
VVIPVPDFSWQLPFRAIGVIGILWALLWLATVRTHHVAPPAIPSSHEGTSDSYWALWKNRRFIVLMIVIVSVNVTWRTFGTWLPKFLQDGRGYSERTMQYFSSLYYLGADIGSISVGLLTLVLVRRGVSLHTSRLITFGFCALLTLLSLLAVFLPQGNVLLVVILLIGFGALGLCPTYFALSQEVSAKHQGKVTGTLGCINAAIIGTIAPLQGRLIDETKSFSWALGSAGLPPLFALIIVYFFWNPPPSSGADKKV